MKWAVAFVGDDNKERNTLFSSDHCYFSMSVCVRWYSPDLAAAAGVKRLRFYAARPVFYDANDRPLPNGFVSVLLSCIVVSKAVIFTFTITITVLLQLVWRYTEQKDHTLRQRYAGYCYNKLCKINVS